MAMARKRAFVSRCLAIFLRSAQQSIFSKYYKKHGPAALPRGLNNIMLGGDVAISASEAFLRRFRASNKNNFQEEKMGGTFVYRDADQFGAAQYNIGQTRGNDEVVDAQFALAKSGHLKFSDIVGGVGKRTLAAIGSWASATAAIWGSYTSTPQRSSGTGMMTLREIAKNRALRATHLIVTWLCILSSVESG